MFVTVERDRGRWMWFIFYSGMGICMPQNGYLYASEWVHVCYRMGKCMLHNGYLYTAEWVPVCCRMGTCMLQNGYPYAAEWVPVCCRTAMSFNSLWYYLPCLLSFENKCNGADMSLCSLWCCRDAINVDAVTPDASTNVGSIFFVSRSSHSHFFPFIFTENQVMTELQKLSSRRSCSAYLKKTVNHFKRSYL